MTLDDDALFESLLACDHSAQDSPLQRALQSRPASGYTSEGTGEGGGDVSQLDAGYLLFLLEHSPGLERRNFLHRVGAEISGAERRRLLQRIAAVDQHVR